MSALFYLHKNSLTDCRPLMRISGDEGKSWSEPTVCIDAVGYNVLNNDRAVQLKGGRLVLPVSLHNTPSQNRFDGGVISCYLSDDNRPETRFWFAQSQGRQLVFVEHVRQNTKQHSTISKQASMQNSIVYSAVE